MPQLDAAIGMLFGGEDILAVRTVSRAAFRTLDSLTRRRTARRVLITTSRQSARSSSIYFTNYLKHADRDTDVPIDNSFYANTEAGIGMAISLYVYHANAITDEMQGYQIWAALTQPKLFDLPQDLVRLVDDWRASKHANFDKIPEAAGILAPRSFAGSSRVRPENQTIQVSLTCALSQ